MTASSLPNSYLHRAMSLGMMAQSFGATLPSPSIKPVTDPTSMQQAILLLGDAEKTIEAQAQKIRQLESLVVSDELTGVLNRRGFMIHLRRELSSTRRDKKNNGLLVLIDLDDFKQINDAHGHAAGDAYLQSVASVLLTEVRSTDYVARLGGDEFAVLMTQISAKEAGKRLDALEKVFHKRFMHALGLSLPLRASFGFAVTSETETPESLLVAADAKLYAQKAQKRRSVGKA